MIFGGEGKSPQGAIPRARSWCPESHSPV